MNPQDPIYWVDNLTNRRLFAGTMEKLTVNSKPTKTILKKIILQVLLMGDVCLEYCVGVG